MASEASYKITLSNNKTEKEAVDYLIQTDNRFLRPTNESRKTIAKKLNLPSGFTRTYDLLLIDGHKNEETEIELIDNSRITLIEIKSTRKRLVDIPYGFFFGATENEFRLAELLGNNFKFCFVCLHPETPGYKLLTLEDMSPLIKNKRTQFQINLDRKRPE